MISSNYAQAVSVRGRLFHLTAGGYVLQWRVMEHRHAPDSAPAILTVNQHAIDPTKIEGRVWQIARILQRNGYRAYIVGGAVRDMLLRKQPKDTDLVSDATPNQIKRLFRNAFLIGKRFRLAHLRYGQEYIEVATFRKEADTELPMVEGEDFARHKRVYGSPRDDAFRRDFTVNGMFYDLKTCAVIDYVGGLADLEARCVRTIVDPEVSLAEDPVRMVRAVRLAGRHQFTIEPSLRAAIVQRSGDLAVISKSRLYEEMGNLLNYGAAERSVLLAHELGMLAHLFPPWDEVLRDPATAPVLRAAFRYFDNLPQKPSDGLAWSWFLLPCLLKRLRLTLDQFYWEASPQAVADDIQSFFPEIPALLPVPKAVRAAVRDILLMQLRFVGNRRAGNFGKIAKRHAFLEALEGFAFYTQTGARGAAAQADLAQRLPRD